jgi:hypothetical protein
MFVVIFIEKLSQRAEVDHARHSISFAWPAQSSGGYVKPRSLTQQLQCWRI